MLEFWAWNLGKYVRISGVLVEIRNENFVIAATAMCDVLTEFVLLSATSWFCDNFSYLQSSELPSRQASQGFGLHVAMCS